MLALPVCHQQQPGSSVTVQAISPMSRCDKLAFTVSQQQQQLSSPMTVQVVTRGALLHFKMGSEERARSLFEGCLRNYPARLDLWSQYLDQVGSASALKQPYTAEVFQAVKSMPQCGWAFATWLRLVSPGQMSQT